MDMVVTLHACDTATDFALAKAVRWNAKVILSVPCCQHELNGQMRSDVLEPLFRYGIIKERIAALATDALRAELLEQQGYRVQILEFIDMEHTPVSYTHLDVYKRQHFMIEKMDCYVEAIKKEELKILPKAAYDEVIRTMLKYPVKEVEIYQPGPWGAYRYKDFWDIPGLECNAWNELAGPELSILIDVDREEQLNLPFVNLMQYPDKLLGRYLSETYPHLFPLDAWLDDGYFPDKQPAERISMPIHTHPSTDYVKTNFNEPIGRYETYYIAEAYEGANTWMGFYNDADLEEWEAKCRKSNNQEVIEDWKEYVCNWESNVGDLYLIPVSYTHLDVYKRQADDHL